MQERRQRAYMANKNLFQALRQLGFREEGEEERLQPELQVQQQAAVATAAPAVAGSATQGGSTAPAVVGSATQGGSISRIAPMARWPTPSDDEEEEEIVHPWSRRSRPTMRRGLR